MYNPDSSAEGVGASRAFGVCGEERRQSKSKWKGRALLVKYLNGQFYLVNA